jgi:hypothetical protein
MEGLGVTAYPHEREAQEIEATPQVWIVRFLIILGEAYAPNSVYWTGLHKDA